MIKITRHIFPLLAMFTMAMLSCKNQPAIEGPVLFEVLKADKTGLQFNNVVTATEKLNMFKYMYFYNGAGLGAGDFNNDGLTDVFFAANQGDNKLYLNEGKLHFKDVTVAATIPQDGGWSTGVSVTDINNDGLLDIYICRVGKFEILSSKNQLLICKGIKNGIPFYNDEAKEYGLDFSGFSTQAAFFDYDLDGDLDMYLLNHSVNQSSSFAPRINFTNTYSALSGDRLYRNDVTRFTDVTKQAGINSSEIGYGLGIAVSDINLDGWPDLYIGNDFHENDYLYINQKNGTFAEENNVHLMHTSKFTMGVDIADINNDGLPEIISTDMLAADPYILKRSLGDDDYDVFFSKIAAGYNYQYSRNNLQYNRGNGMFSETGAYSGIYATDWSWAPLFMDFDNDGLKDLFIANGIPKRLNDMDYVNFIYNTEVQEKLKNNNMKDKDMALMKNFPEIKIPNKFYKNSGNLHFTDMETAVSNDQPTYSNGAVYADFDNDGDLDVAVNNINDAALLYENKTAKAGNKNFVSIKLKGPEKNRNAVGTKIILFKESKIEMYEKKPVRGFMSAMEIPVHIGMTNTKIDSAFVVWPDNSVEKIVLDTVKQQLFFSYTTGLPHFNYDHITSFSKNILPPVTDITTTTLLQYIHKENVFNEFDREPLIPHMLSTEGPAIAVADINKDGLEDVFMGASKTFHNAVFLQQANGTFIKTIQTAMLADSMYEDVDAVWADVNNDGNTDLIIASGGNEYYGKDEHLLPRVYLNDGKANFTKLQNAFSGLYITPSCMVASDFNADGFVDLFIGGRTVPWNYGEIPASYLLQNDGKGKFTDVTNNYAKELTSIGMVTSAVWVDMDKDNDKDLLISCEWGGIYAFINEQNNFIKKELTTKKGWWNFVQAVDIDNDGDTDLVAGNLGLNSRLQASAAQPVRLYYNDFDDNGKKEQVLTYYIKNKEISFAGKDELQRQIPMLKKKYIYAADFAKATFKDILPEEKISAATTFTADYFASAVLINNGNFNFTTTALPWQAQLSTYRDACIADINKDNLPDIILAGNYYSNNIHAGRYDADFGTVLINKGKGNFACANFNGPVIKGEVRHIRPISIGKQMAYILAKNNEALQVVQFSR